MSFFTKFKTGSADAAKQANATPTKKDPNALQPTSLEKHLADVTGPVRSDGSDKFFGFENYGYTCYCNSIIQCLYYSAPFREHVINFPSTAFVDQIRATQSTSAPLVPKKTNETEYPHPLSPARKQTVPPSPGGPPPTTKPEDDKNNPDLRKRQALAAGPVLDMIYDHSMMYSMEESLFTALRDIFEAIISNQSRLGVVSPLRFWEILKRDHEAFRSPQHQDAHEFLNLLLNQVVDNVEMFAKQHPKMVQQPHMNGSASKEMTLSKTNSTDTSAAMLDTHWVHDLFEGTLTSETRCLTCENTSQRDEPFLDLSVDLDVYASVTSCLRKFSEEEMLCERNKFHCDNCGGLQEAEKRMKIKRLPRILALHLKRFKYTEDMQRLGKLFHRVSYPFYLRLFNTTDEAEDPERLYELYSVVVHIGGTAYHGHYVCIIKTQDRGWLLFDDELVEPVSKDYVQQFFGGEPIPGVQDAKQLATAYVLFYQETTMEAMLKEQEAESGQTTEMPIRVSDGELSRDSLSSPIKGPNGLVHTMTNIQTPIAEEDLKDMDPLAHAATAPNLPHQKLFEQPPPPMPIMPNISKKEQKQKEKLEEKERKAAEKEERKAKEAKYREASAKRMERFKQADDDMKRILDESKRTAAMEAEARGEPIKDAEKGSLSRFKHGSMSLSRKPGKIFGSKKEREGSENGEKQPILPLANGIGEEAAVEEVATPSDSNKFSASTTVQALETQKEETTALPALPQQGEKPRKHRFSLGRKKSTLY